MKKVISLTLSVLLYSQYIFAVCDKPVTYLTETTPTPCNGYLFTPEKEQDVRVRLGSYDKLLELNSKQDQLITTLNGRIEVQQKLNDNISEQLYNREKHDKWTNMLWFIGGAFITTTIVYVVKKTP